MGLHRHVWWDTQLPGAPGVVVKFSPIFNAIWVASDAQHLREPTGDGMRTASPRGHALSRAHLSLLLWQLVTDSQCQ